MKRCNECGHLIDPVPGVFYCPGGQCRARYHARLLGKDLETRKPASPVRQGTTVARAWTALAAEAASTYHQAARANRV